MGKGKKSRTQRAHARNNQPHNGKRGNGNANGIGQNAFAALAQGSDDVTEMNGQLPERFPQRDYPDPERVPLSALPRANNDIFKYFQDAGEQDIGTAAWCNKSEIPLPSEILTPPGAAFAPTERIVDLDDGLRPNKVEGMYENNEEYLGTQYDLLREDAVRPLRDSVDEVRKDPWRDELAYPQSSGIGIYEPTYITGIVFSPRGLAARVAFSLSRVKKYIRWKQSKRLITGTLVALSPAEDAFRTQCILATVAARPLSALEANPPELDLFFARPQDFQLDPMRKWIMVECRSSFFEASRHTLLSLQHMMHEPFPLSNHLVKAKKDVDHPAYVMNNPFTDMSSLVSLEEAEQFQNLDILREWPAGDTHSLDNSQSKALRRILTSQLAIVQGPPGTGKTHVSVVALKIMLANLRKDDPPIIVTCQTNHALDQLLLHVAEFEPKFIRLGGRSKDRDKIKKRTLFEVRQSFSQEKEMMGSRKNTAMSQMRYLTKQMQMLLAPLEQGKSCLDHRLLVHYRLITEKQAESLEVDAQFAMGIAQNAPGILIEQWLGKNIIECRRPIQPDDFGMAYEEEDFDEVEQLQELEAEAVARDDDDDIEALKGPVTSLSDNYTGRSSNSTLASDDHARAKLDQTPDLGLIPGSDRGAIYQYFQRKVKEYILREFKDLAVRYEKLVLLRKIGQWEKDQRLLADQRLIGMTTTGLSKYRALVASLRPRVVLVEEAAETLEAPVTAACVPTLEHLILVGDHQQLRPHCQLRAIEDEPYNFNLSLFERMVNNEIEYASLARQRRMIPEIRRLLEPIYGNTLKDHDSVNDVSNRPPVEGMGGYNSFFFTHEWPEGRDNNMSTYNDGEANMIVGLCDHLVLNGVEPKKITILTFYNGQRTRLLKQLRFNQNLRSHNFTVVTVDSYQGEENDIVLLSLVRSNKSGNIGFLAVDNRVCVALSRAKRGFYIFGNAELLAVQNNTWESVVKILWGREKKLKESEKQKLAAPARRIGYHLPVECTNHGRKVFLESPDDWEFINGGCDEPCKCTLPCGHICQLKCHPFDNALINCTQKCGKPIPTCGHLCGEMCCDPCKCTMCDSRNKGYVSLLKPQPKNTANSGAIPYSRPAPAGFARGPQTPAVPAQSSMSQSGRTPDLRHWHAYTNGGAKAEDQETYRKAQEEQAKVLKMISDAEQAGPSQQAEPSQQTGRLIEVSPQKKSAGVVSKNTELLIDIEMDALDLNTKDKGRVSHTETFSYMNGVTPSPQKGNWPNEAESKPSQPIFDLLD